MEWDQRDVTHQDPSLHLVCNDEASAEAMDYKSAQGKRGQMSEFYMPYFRTNPSEVRGYRKLDDTIKDFTLPYITLCRRGQDRSLQGAMSEALEIVGDRPVILDFDPAFKPPESDEKRKQKQLKRDEKKRQEGKEIRTPTAKQQALWNGQRRDSLEAAQEFQAEMNRLQSSIDGFAEWRQFVSAQDNIIPAICIGGGAESIAQARHHLQSGKRIAVRLDLANALKTQEALTLLAALSSLSGVIVIFDIGYVRTDQYSAQRKIADTLEEFRRTMGEQKYEQSTKVCMSNSFPGTLQNMPTPLRILERDIYDVVKEKFPGVNYGDHASVFRRGLMQAAAGWYAHVEVAHTRQWCFALSESISDGEEYPKLARQLVSDSATWRDRCASWGTDVVLRVSRGLADDGEDVKMTVPGPWVGVRLNQHITQQVLALS